MSFIDEKSTMNLAIKRSGVIFSVLMAVWLGACSKSEPPPAAPAPEPEIPAPTAKLELPEPSGQYAIGVVDFELVDTAREETFAPGQPRRIPVRAWYPATSVSGEPRLYATPAEIEHVVRGFLDIMPVGDGFVTSRENLPTHSYEQAEPLADGPRPTVIFSHGAFANLGSNTVLMEHLASNGYLVLSISHPYVSSATMHENGDIIPGDQPLIKAMFASAQAGSRYMDAYQSNDIAVRLEETLRNNETSPLAPHFKIWQKDFVHVIDRLESGDLPAKAAKLLPLVDMNRLGTFGMSFGASGSATTHQDERIKAAVNLDGGVFDSALVDYAVPVPVLVMHQDPSGTPYGNIHTHSEFVYEPFETMGTREDVIRVTTLGSTHMDYTDATLTPISLREANPGVAALLGTIEGARMVDIMNQFVHRFFDHYLSGEGTGLDATFRAQYPEVVDVNLDYVREWAATNPEPGFMSQTHVFTMNRLLAADKATREAAAKLDRTYVMAYELTNSLRGGTEWWQVIFDPKTGVTFSLEAPTTEPDLKFSGDYAEYIRFMKKLSAREAKEEDQPVTTSGNAEMMTIVAETFAAAGKAATIKSKMPDL